MTRKVMPACVLALTVLVLAATGTQAAKGGGGKPPKNPTPTPEPVALDGGPIYYFDRATDPVEVRSISPDGANDTQVPGVDYSWPSRPSELLHNGDRWFVVVRASSNDHSPGFFPGARYGGRLWELDVVREGAATTVPLTDNAGSCIQIGGQARLEVEWGPDATGQVDGAISWVGARWQDTDNDGSCDVPVEAGVFRGEIDIDALGNVTFSQPTAPEIVVPLDGTTPRADAFDWAPDGEQLAYSDTNGYALRRVDAAGNVSQIFDGRVFSSVDWSPDLDPATAGLQTKVAFTGAVLHNSGVYYRETGTYTVNPDGSGLMQVAAGIPQRRNVTDWINHWGVSWSPVGSHLVYTEGSSPPLLHRVDASGGNDVVLATTGLEPNGIAWVTD